MKVSKKTMLILCSCIILLTLLIVYLDIIIDVNRGFKDYMSRIDFTGAAAPFLFIGMQIMQVLVFFIPGEIIQAMGGYAFGPLIGTVLSILGITIGSSIQYVISKNLGSFLLKNNKLKKSMKSIYRLLHRERNKFVLFILYLLPGFPKDMLGYIAGVSGIGFGSFITITTVARIPGIAMSIAFGSNLFYENYLILLYILVITGIIAYISISKRDKIMQFLK